MTDKTNKSGYQYDYENQAWLKDGKYIKCGHTNECQCYGKIHAGETPKTTNWIK